MLPSNRLGEQPVGCRTRHPELRLHVLGADLRLEGEHWHASAHGPSFS